MHKRTIVPITLQFDFSKIIGSFEIEERYAEMLCTTNKSIALRQGYMVVGKRLMEISLCREPVQRKP